MEVALAVVLLSGAGLMLKSFWRMNAFPPGFEPNKILVTKISLSGPQYKAWPQQHTYIDELFRRIQAVPGVQAAGIHCSNFNTTIQVEGVAPDNQPFAAIRYVSTGYLRALGLPLVEGHWPTEDESLDMVMVNRSFARRVTSSGNLIGKHIHASLLSATIAGIIPDFKVSQLDAEPGPEIYAAYQLSPRISLITALVRISGDPKRFAPEIRKLISGIDQNVPAYQVETLERQLTDSIAPRRFNMFLLSSFAAAALLLALIGIYGVIAYSVAQRSREIGIRMALGAQRLEMVGMVMRQGMAIVMAGVVAGFIAAIGLARLMISLLYGVKPDDAPTFLIVAAALSLMALFACAGPALKAALVDPIVALRYE
jgi:putative ABC transport system permease protein